LFLPTPKVKFSVFANPDLGGTIPIGMCDLAALETIEVGVDQVQCTCDNSKCSENGT
jgi:hypothetical protein